VAPAPSPSTATATGFTEVASKPCPDSRFTCVTLAVPNDHFGPADGPTWDVTYAIQRASGERLGTFVVITGGPGSSGISVADDYTDYYPTSIPEHYDIVFLDQRGIGLSGPIQCIDAAATYYATTTRAQDAAQRDALAAEARSFATDCIAEAGVAEADLPLYATTQAVEDLEAVRAHLGADKLHLYGESYGTQFVQYYAAAHPDRIAALFVDGPVDLTIGAIPYYVEAARSAEDTLVETLEACTADETCKADIVGGDALAVYDSLRERLGTAPIPIDFPTATGTTQRRELTIADLENAAFGYIYSPGDRAIFLRAIAAASRDNLVPLARIAYDSIGLDPETLEAEVDPTWSDAMYYAVECQDYAFYPDGGDPDARLDAWLADGVANGINELRLGTTFYGDLPCLYWPTATTRADRPAPLADPDYPVFVMTSTTDPATPIANAMRIYARLDDAYFIQTVGGPHVIFGWGEACPDEVIGAYLAEGTPPRTRVLTCDGAVADEFVPLAAARVGDYDDALDLMTSMDDQILTTDDYQNRLDDVAITMGCDFGGTLTYTPTDSGTAIDLDGCAFTPGAALSGTGTVDDDAGTFELDVTGEGDDLHYERDADGNTSVRGTYDGETVRLEAAA
jgi:pimeloyl-ACP methyl ester carboxylesterase